MTASTPARPATGLRFRRDSALRSRAARGDAAAFAEVYERHHQALYRYCRSIVHNDEDARDALQSAMMRAFAALRTEERDFELRPWLFRIAHNEAISLLRRRRETQDVDAIEHAGEETLDQQVAQREELAMLRADLDELSEQQRAALVLRELNGLGHDEIAAVLGVSASAVKAAIFDARSALHEYREGRSMTCEGVRRVLSDRDGRALRGRKLRAHLRACRGCQDFLLDLERRPARLAAIAPPLPAAASAALLAHLLPSGKAVLAGATGASGSTAASGGLASTAASGGAASTAASGGIAGSLAAKAAVTAIVAAGATGGAVAVTHHTHSRPAAPPPAQSTPTRPPAVAPAVGQEHAPGAARRTASPGEHAHRAGGVTAPAGAHAHRHGQSHSRTATHGPGSAAAHKAHPSHPHPAGKGTAAKRHAPMRPTSQTRHATGHARSGTQSHPTKPVHPTRPAGGGAPAGHGAPAPSPPAVPVSPPAKPTGPGGPSNPADSTGVDPGQSSANS